MSSDLRICLVGLGEVGQTLATDLLARNVRHLAAWDILFSDNASAPSRAGKSLGVRRGASARDAVVGADLVISAVTAGEDIDAVRSIAPHLDRNAFFLDVNSVSPAVKHQAARIVEAAGGRYVEAAIMSPISPRRIASPMLLGGPHATDFMGIARPLGFDGAEVFSREIGRASAAKMCRSVVVKGMEALLGESLLAARHYGVEDDVLASLKGLLPVENWPALARYMISRSLIHGQRRAEEMREVARTVADAGVDPWMSCACAQRQDWAAQHRDAASQEDLAAMLDRMRERQAK